MDCVLAVHTSINSWVIPGTGECTRQTCNNYLNAFTARLELWKQHDIFVENTHILPPPSPNPVQYAPIPFLAGMI